MENDLWVLDTHIWIRTLNGDPELNLPGFLQELERHAQAGWLRIADITLWETAMLSAKNRLKLSLPVLAWLDQALAMPGLSVVPVDARIAADSSFLPGEFHGDPADRLITATARVHQGTVITFDRAILAYGAEGWVKAVSPADVTGVEG